MYTRCPSCRAEISFEPPVHADSLPDGYKHKIKCPSCGVTIGVKIPRHEVAVQPTYVPQNPNAVTPEETYEAPMVADDNIADEAVAPAKAKKKGFGRAASAFAMIWALLITGFFVVAYLASTGIIPETAILGGIAQYDAITPIIALFQPGYIAEAWASEGVGANLLWLFVPSMTLLFAFIHFIVSFSCLCAGKYSKGYNVIWTLILFAGTALSLLYPAMYLITTGALAELTLTAGEAILALLKGFVEEGMWIALIVAPALGFVAFLTSLCSLGVKNPNKQRRSKSVE